MKYEVRPQLTYSLSLHGPFLLRRFDPDGHSRGGRGTSQSESGRSCVLRPRSRVARPIPNSRLPTPLGHPQLELRNYYRLDAAAVAAHLGSDVAVGLAPAEAAARLRKGRNEVAPPRDTPMWARYLLSYFSGFGPVRARPVVAGIAPSPS